jgi:hypothetical protein
VIVTALADALVVVAVVLVVALVVAFFGTLAHTAVGGGVLRIASYVTLPFGIEPVRTAYGGVFMYDAALTVVLALAAEWALGATRYRL